MAKPINSSSPHRDKSEENQYFCAHPFDAKNATKVKLLLKGSNKLKNIKSTTDNVPELCALYIPINANAELIIENRASGNEPVGELIATGGYHSAGIGQASASTDPTHKFIINSGIITANGDTYAAGIGASHGKTYLGEITINGGIVYAKGGGVPAIGGGGGKITINGGLVFANLIGDAANYRGNQNTDEMLTLSDEEFKYDGLPKHSLL